MESLCSRTLFGLSFLPFSFASFPTYSPENKALQLLIQKQRIIRENNALE
jgi:hypothetical protein